MDDTSKVSQLCSSLSLPIITPSSPSYPSLTTPYAHRFSPRPLGIIRPSSSAQLSSFFSSLHASNVDLPIWPRAGGHSYAAASTPDGKWVVDCRDMNWVRVQGEEVMVGSGARLGVIALALDKEGRAMPHGTCPYVGATGHTLAGGFGFWSRAHGLACDNLLSVKGVLWNGGEVVCSLTENEDLFWALRGAGQYLLRPNGAPLIIITELTYRTYPKPTTVTYFSYEREIREEEYGWLERQLLRWQEWAKIGVDPELGPQWRLKGGKVLQIHGVYHRPPSEDVHWQTDMEDFLGLKSEEGWKKESEEIEWKRCLGILAGEHGDLEELGRDPDREDDKVAFYAKSLVVGHREGEELDETKVKRLFDYTRSIRTDLSWWIEANIWGGAISSPPSSNAFSHRDALLVFQLYVHTADNQPPLPKEGHVILNTMMERLGGQKRGYPGYIDPELGNDGWWNSYFGADVKARCDTVVTRFEAETERRKL
ncbi:FAD-binding domain-containing protein [Atractiella rhizophila]|nr:FAD-binding domain-containing protein [Atractiella rhizophila]